MDENDGGDGLTGRPMNENDEACLPQPPAAT